MLSILIKMKKLFILSILLSGGALLLPINYTYAIESTNVVTAQVDPTLTFSLGELQENRSANGLNRMQNLIIATNEKYGYGMTVKYIEKDVLKSVYSLEIEVDNKPKSETINVGIPDDIFEKPSTIVYSLMPGY